METESKVYRRLYRSRQNRVIAGICGGLGDYFNIDPVVIRVIWLATILLGGTGVLAYFLAWILVPEGKWRFSEKSAHEEERQPGVWGTVDGTRVIGIVLIVIALVWLAVETNMIPFFSWNWMWPLGLIVLGVAFLLKPSIVARYPEKEQDLTTDSEAESRVQAAPEKTDES